jgi:hypothetical protein
MKHEMFIEYDGDASHGRQTMSTQYQVLIKAESAADPSRIQILEDNESLFVRDLTTRATIQIRARELSLYRHTLFIDGKAYRILHLVRVPSGTSHLN